MVAIAEQRVLSRRLVDAVQISGVKADVMENTTPRMCEVGFYYSKAIKIYFVHSSGITNTPLCV